MYKRKLDKMSCTKLSESGYAGLLPGGRPCSTCEEFGELSYKTRRRHGHVCVRVAEEGSQAATAPPPAPINNSVTYALEAVAAAAEEPREIVEPEVLTLTHTRQLIPDKGRRGRHKLDRRNAATPGTKTVNIGDTKVSTAALLHSLCGIGVTRAGGGAKVTSTAVAGTATSAASSVGDLSVRRQQEIGAIGLQAMQGIACVIAPRDVHAGEDIVALAASKQTKATERAAVAHRDDLRRRHAVAV